MRIRTKLLALILVPVLAIALAAAVGFASQSRAIETAESSTETVARTNTIYDAVVAVGAERLMESGADLGMSTTELRAATDETVAELSNADFDALSEELANDLSAARNESGAAATSAYSEINAKLLDVRGDTAEQYPNAVARQDAIVNRLAVESLEIREQAWLSYLATNEVTIETASTLSVKFANSKTSMDRVEEFSSDAQVGAFLGESSSEQLTRLETVALSDLSDQNLSVSSEQALLSLAEFRTGWASIIETGNTNLDQSVNNELADENDLRSLFTLLAAIGVIVGAGLIFVIYRSITEPLSSLLDRANQVAHEDLPSLVMTLRDSENDGELPKAEPIPVTSNDEIGELVTAFNDVQVTAYDLATEQALGRRAVGEMFVNLGRRNQRLLERILAKLTELQQEEEDPDALASLFELDNIVTRMRRNAESLLVMAGATTPRQWSQSVNIDNTVRAAVGEVEGYQRIDIANLEPVDLRGNAVSDIAHLLAELLENSVNFSDGESPVQVTGQFERDTYVLNVIDNGIGMTAEEFEANNSRITDPPPVDQIPTKFLGLYVVGRLSDRHGIDVRLSDAPGGGVLARIALPATLMAAEVAAEKVAPSSASALNTALSVQAPTTSQDKLDDVVALDDEAVSNDVDYYADDESEQDEFETEEIVAADDELEQGELVAEEVAETDEADPANENESVGERTKSNRTSKRSKSAAAAAVVAPAVVETTTQAEKKLNKRSVNNKTKRRKDDEAATKSAPTLPTRQRGNTLKSSSPPEGVERRAGEDGDGNVGSKSNASAHGASDFSSMMSSLSSGITKGEKETSGDNTLEDSALEDSALENGVLEDDATEDSSDRDSDRKQKS